VKGLKIGAMIVIVVGAMVYIFKPWPIFDLKDKDGVLINPGIFNFFDPGHKVGTYITYEVDPKKIPDGLSAREALKIAYENMENRCDTIDGPKVIMNGKNQIVVFLPGFKTVNIIKRLENFPVVELKSSNNMDKSTKPFLIGTEILDAEIRRENSGKYEVWVKLNKDGGKRFSEFFDKNAGKDFDVVVDGRIFRAFAIKPGFKGFEGIIADKLPEEVAKDIVLILRAGIKVPLILVDEHVINPIDVIIK
jgi:preprotein translocase subunit SecD